MPPLVLQLQEEATNGSTPMPDVLRKARMVATKLKLGDMNSWIQYELHGYPLQSVVPEYRLLQGDVRALNPYNGYLMPVRLGNPKVQDKISECELRQSIGSLYEVTKGPSEDLRVPFSEERLEEFRRVFTREANWFIPFRMIDKAQVTSIFDAVRNRILDWTLQLESEGVLGEGLTFTPQEKDRAAAMTSINIGSVQNINGVIGSVTESTLHIDNVSAVDGALKAQGFTTEQRTEIQQLIAEYKAAPKDGKLTVAKRGIQWVVDHAQQLGSLASLFRDFFVR